MARCEICGNDYDKAFTITTVHGDRHTFDSFECAINGLAPSCAHCGCKIVGHGVDRGETIFCCDHCARHAEHEHHAHDQQFQHAGAIPLESPHSLPPIIT